MTSDFSKFKELSDVMDIKQLFFRLTDNQQKLIEVYIGQMFKKLSC